MACMEERAYHKRDVFCYTPVTRLDGIKAVVYWSYPGKATMSQRLWGQRFGLVLLMLLMTVVRGDGQAGLPDSGSPSPQFVMIVLGTAGGLHEANLTSY